MTKRIFLWLFWPLLALWATWVLWAISAQAQIVTPIVPENMLAYTTADPVDADRYGLATQDGRYSFRLLDGCDYLPIYQNVLVRQTEGEPIALVTDQWACPIEIIARMADSPCFTNEQGQCDAAVTFDQ